VEQARRPNTSVSVVIATAALPERRAALLHAIDSALDQTPRPTVVVVVNGLRFDREVYSQLERHSGVTLAYSEQPSYPAAQRLGRTLVRSDYCCFLDDDDELLPGSIESRVARAERADRPDVVVSAGYRRVGPSDVPCSESLPREGEDLRLHLLGQGWFASCAPLMRCETVDESFFDGSTRYFEWTLIAFRLIAAGKRFVFVDQPGFRINESAVSLSKDVGGVRSLPDFVHKLLSTAPPEHVRRVLRRRLSRAHHACASLELGDGQLARAWSHHLSSLVTPGGLSYLLYTRYLLAASLGLRRSTSG
jgi:glycosyltransferase involved in cell wall biosynthesis